jgi:hypothetical protein
MFPVSCNILKRWKNYFCQLLNVHDINDDRRIEIYTAELLVPAPSSFEAEIAIEQLRRYKSLSIDQTAEEMIRTAGNILCS